ncbi:hypothetical protein, partial [Falsiroseomonas sp.]|uniref:hypothetical protein n=1 Tax=Falsiroseomonas sp. TaxID=2870721 RepID=UPI002718B74B
MLRAAGRWQRRSGTLAPPGGQDHHLQLITGDAHLHRHLGAGAQVVRRAHRDHALVGADHQIALPVPSFDGAAHDR